METNENETLLDAAVVAKWLGVAPSTIYDQAARGVLPHVRLWKGSRRTVIRFRRDDIERFVRERTCGPRSDR